MLAILGCLDRGERNAGDTSLGVPSGEGDSRAEKRRSKGCSDPGRYDRVTESCDGARLLGGEDKIEFCRAVSLDSCEFHRRYYPDRRGVVWY